jgi:hypothetical protein
MADMAYFSGEQVSRRPRLTNAQLLLAGTGITGGAVSAAGGYGSLIEATYPACGQTAGSWPYGDQSLDSLMLRMVTKAVAHSFSSLPSTA